MSNADQPGRTGPYRHIRLVYAGQSSQLWKARDERDGKIVAVKRLLPTRVDREHIALLNNEHRVAESLKGSSSFLKVYDAGRDGGIPYLILEWFPAPSVGQLVKLGYETYSPVLPQLIPALFEPLIPLHAAGWVHCDIKPDNFLFSGDDLRLIDWEYAGMQDPHVDVAMFCVYSLYSKSRCDELIDLYFEGRCSRKVRCKLYCYIAVFYNFETAFLLGIENMGLIDFLHFRLIQASTLNPTLELDSVTQSQHED